ncbi:MAG: hypothetical protein ABIR91_02020 [Candidatus Saccharimonadales bacterium]
MTITSLALRLVAMATVVDGIKTFALLNDERLKLVAVFVATLMLGNLCIAEFTKFFIIDTNTVNFDKCAILVVGTSVHYGAPLLG